MAKPDDLIEKRAESYRNVFGGPAGEFVLNDLRAKYRNRRLFNKDPLVMAQNAALHDAIVEIEWYIAVGRGEIKYVKPKVTTEKRDNRYDADQIIVPEES